MNKIVEKMEEWTPITENEIDEKLNKTQLELTGDLLNFWQLILVEPQKWSEKEYGNEGNGFWVVAIAGKRVIWYNDIEEGFNISSYAKYGEIEEYLSHQDELKYVIMKLYKLIKFGKEDVADQDT
jgi:hypothetical protein